MDNNFNFINDGFNNDLRPTTSDSQAENPNVNFNASCNYNNNNSYPTMNGDVSSVSYSNTPGNFPMSSQSYPIASSDPPLFLPQYIAQNAPQFVQNNSSPSSMTDSSQINHTKIFTFEIPGIKIIVIPTFPLMINSSQTNNSEIFTFDIPGSKVIIVTLSFQ
ncbi:hypothetical protein RhiirA5_464773 [Rhizophagus irregularis]|uniref:Uncharacterized protein n=1 Tax=Rhizophagus irregularis TaxID=588596 RepID=A0A2I1H9B2_9GLOM|nr:hypothetical protein RhiirA5_464773 [Rhizophagus irregularis]PKC71543.1 hypothetical protein RhiirA1_390504 [Rhizophagus irregularis]PKY55462.1 hypothetical protein RhiirA4_504329 [Rhizophagus irregularis]